MASTVGEGFLYPAKPFNTINPTGMDAAQSIDVLQKDVMQRRELASAERDRQMKAQQADADRQAQLQEAEKARQFEAGQKDKELNWSADQAKQQQIAASEEQRKREIFEAGQNDKSRALQERQIEQERTQSDRMYQMQREETDTRNSMEATSLKLQALAVRRKALDEDYNSRLGQIDEDGVKEYKGRIDAMDQEELDIIHKSTFLTTASAIVKADTPEAQTEVFNYLDEQIEGPVQAVNKQVMRYQDTLEMSDKAVQQFDQSREPNMFQKVVRGVGMVFDPMGAGEDIGGFEEGTTMLARAQARWKPVGEQLAAAAVGDFQPKEGSAVVQAGMKVSEFLAKLDASVNAKDPESAANLRQQAVDLYKQMKSMKMNMAILDSSLTGLYKAANGEGLSAADALGAANSMVKSETGMTPPPTSKAPNNDVARVLRAIGSLYDEKGSPLAENFGGKALVQFKSKNGKLYAYSQLREDAISTLIMVQRGMESVSDPRAIMDGALDGDPSTFPVLAEWQQKLPPEVWSAVERHLKKKSEDLQAMWQGENGDKILGIEDDQSYGGERAPELMRRKDQLGVDREKVATEKATKIMERKKGEESKYKAARSLLDDSEATTLEEEARSRISGRR